MTIRSRGGHSKIFDVAGFSSVQEMRARVHAWMTRSERGERALHAQAVHDVVRQGRRARHSPACAWRSKVHARDPSSPDPPQYLSLHFSVTEIEPYSVQIVARRAHAEAERRDRRRSARAVLPRRARSTCSREQIAFRNRLYDGNYTGFVEKGREDVQFRDRWDRQACQGY